MSNFSINFSFDTAAEAIAFLQSVGAPAAVPTAAVSTAAAAPKATRTRKAAEEAPAAAPRAVDAVRAAPVNADGLKKVAIQKLVTLINANDALGRNGKQVCTDLCNKFGGRNISAISADKYPAVIAEVDKALEALNSDASADPTA